MLKYNDIIIKLTDEQKIRILTDVGNISNSDMRAFDIPEFRAVYMSDCKADKYPRASALAHSWDKTLWEEVAKAKVFEAEKEGATFLITPGAKIKFSPYCTELSEDTYLASSISAAYAKAVTDLGLSAGVSDLYLTDSDVEWMDMQPDTRALDEYLIKQYLDVLEETGADTVLTGSGVSNENYADACRYLQDGAAKKAKFFVCGHADDSCTVDYISRGIICLEASSSALGAALSEYRKLKKQIEQSNEEREDLSKKLDEALALGKAISDESIDNALDNTFEFMFECANNRRSALAPDVAGEELALRATLESTVLLKNDNNILPLSKGKKIGIIGDIAFSDTCGQQLALECRKMLESAGYQCVGVSKGYDVNDLHTNEYMDEVFNICKDSDVVLFFCGTGYEQERMAHITRKLTLPANQLYMADMILRYKKATVAIIMSNNAPDVEFLREFNAALLTPCEVGSSAQAISDVLSGAYSPTGKLAYTLYSGTDAAFLKANAYMKKFGMRSGPFVGYRYYDTDRVSVGYPFGHGLSYTEFEYSNLSVSEEKLSFTVKNIGNVRGTETAQIYLGKIDSSLIRPRKELCRFVKIELDPLEEKRVTVSITPPKVSYRGEYVTEKGEYLICVGASVSDIRLEGKSFFDGKALEPDGKKRSDYLQSCGNISEGKYTLEAKYSFMKKISKNLFIGIGALILAVSIAIFNATTYTFSLFLGIVAAILGICAVSFFVSDIVERSKQHAADRKKINEENAAHFDDAEQIDVFSTEKIFNDVFDVKKEDAEPEKVAEDVFVDADHAEFITPGFLVSEAVEEFKLFLAERGFKLNRGVAESIISSLMTSRVMIFNGLTSDDFNSLMSLMSEYFGTAPCVDLAKDSMSDNVFFTKDTQGYTKKTNILKALQLAANSHEKIQLAAIDGINENNVNAWLEPFIKYIRISRNRNDIAIFDEDGRNLGYSIARNLWIVMRLDKQHSFEKLPEFVVKNAAVVDVSYSKCPVQEEKTAYRRITFYQTEYIINKETGNKDVSEETWKKIDKIEKYAQQSSMYSIGNKLWLELEKQMDILLACGIETDDALDAVLASRVLPSAVVTLSGQSKEDDITLDQALEMVLGEGKAQHSKAFIHGVANTQSARTSK